MRHTIEWLRRKRSGGAPDTPLPPNATNTTGNGVTLTWTAVPRATFYTLQRSTTTSGPWSDIYVGSELTFDDTGLTAATLYAYRLVASGRFGESQPSLVTVITLDNASPPPTPAAPTIDATTATTVSLSWPAVSTATGYVLQRSVSPFISWTTIYTGPNRTFIDSGLTDATTYHYRLAATNADGSSANSPDAVALTGTATTVPATPAQPTASNITASSVLITWVAPAGATDYVLQRRQTAPAGTGIPTAFATVYSGQNTQFSDVSLASSATYEYKVRATNAAGSSAYSTVRQVITGGTTGTNVQPVSALLLRQNSGVATHPNFNTADKVWKTANAPEYIQLIAQMGVGFIRGAYANPNVFLPELAKYKLKWICGIVSEASGAGVVPPTNDTVAETRATVRAIRENPAAVATIVGIEGINEPNQNRGSGTVSSNWADITVQHQKAIYQESQWNLTSVNGPIGSSPTAGAIQNPLKGVKIYGPSLHDIACENSYSNNPPSDSGPRHWHQLLDLGILNWQDAAGFHCYPGAGIPLRGARNLALIDEGNIKNGEGGNVTGRLELMWSAYGDRYPSYTTESGYHNAIAQVGGHIGITERGSGIYYPRMYLQFFTTPLRINGTGLTNNTACTGFEFLDDQDNGAKDSQELNFGIYGYNDGTDATVPANWRPKPQYNKTKAMFQNFMPESLDAPAYTPNRVFLNVQTSTSPDYLEFVPVASKAQSDAGTATLLIYRRLKCYNRSTKTDVTVPTIPVTITDRVGVHPTTYQVGADVMAIDLR